MENKLKKKEIIILVIILVLTMVIRFFMYGLVNTYSKTGDSNSYKEAIDVMNRDNYYVDSFRTPVYPLTIRIAEQISSIFNNDIYSVTVIIQEIVFVISTIFLYFISKRLFKNKVVSIIAIILYSILPRNYLLE